MSPASAWYPTGDPSAWRSEARRDPLSYWRRSAERIVWDRFPERIFEGDIKNARWFSDGRLNATVSCLDRHAATHPDALAYDYLCENGEERSISYHALLHAVNRLANALARDGVGTGDPVVIYMPLTIEAIVAMLACARLGAIHAVVYAGLGAAALRSRIEDARAHVVLSADLTYRRGKTIDLASILDEAVSALPAVRRIVQWRRATPAQRDDERYRDWDAYQDGCSGERDATIVDAEHPLFILYTSGTTGKPKGIVHVHGGFLGGGAAMFADVCGIAPYDRYWCTSDIGWMTGHNQAVYGSLANRFRCLIREGAPDYPRPSAFYEIVERHRISMIYTSPSLARMLARFGADCARPYDRSSLRALFCGGEPLRAATWRFLRDVVAEGRAAICEHWGQTETGSPLIGHLPTTEIASDRTGAPFGPLCIDVVGPGGEHLPDEATGLLVLREPWPHMLAGVWNDPERFSRYFSIPGCYVAGDLAVRHADDSFTVSGRTDEVLSVAGHRIAAAEVESVLATHPACLASAVIGRPHAIKGEEIKAFVVLHAGHDATDTLRTALSDHVARQMGPIGRPGEIAFVESLPTTRSGKIMRRMLRAHEVGEDPGDVTMLDE